MPERSIIWDSLDGLRIIRRLNLGIFYWIGRETADSLSKFNAAIVAATKGSGEAESKRKKLSAIPGWLVITCNRSDDPLRQQEDYAATYCFIQNLKLVLWSAGIGTKWSTGEVTRHREFFKLLESNLSIEQVVGLIWYGYPDVIPVQTQSAISRFLVEHP